MAFALLHLSLFAGKLAVATEQPPHIVSVMVDDLGSYNSQVNNPNAPGDTIGALVKEGIKLEVTVESPSRITYLTFGIVCQTGTVSECPLSARISDQRFCPLHTNPHFLAAFLCLHVLQPDAAVVSGRALPDFHKSKPSEPVRKLFAARL